MRRGFLITLTLCLAIGLLWVSCNAETSLQKEELVSVSFENGTSRALSASLPSFNAGDYHWYYTATKRDGSPFVNGQTSVQLAVRNGKGLSQVSGFSQGLWQFTLYAYVSLDQDSQPQGLVYSGTSDVVALRSSSTNGSGSNIVNVIVNPVSDSGDGILALDLAAIKTSSDLQSLGAISSIDVSYSEFQGASSPVAIPDVEAASGYVGGVYSVALAPGAYKVTIKFNLSGNSSTSSTLVAMVYSNMTTTVGGSMTGTVSSGQ